MLQNNKEETASRRAKILSQLEEHGQINVKQLSESFSVSEVTIRNDLSYLEDKNLLIRSRGGAIKQQRVGIDFKLAVKSKKYQYEKQKIGRLAAEMIKDGDTIVLDSGTNTAEIAKNLGSFNELTVITNALNIAGILADFGNIRVIMLGGYLRANSLSLVGPMAESALHHYYVDKVFLGVDGIDSAHGISTPIIEEAFLNWTMIEMAKEIFVVTDSSKFKQRSFALIVDTDKIDYVITDSGIPQDEKQNLINAKVKVIEVT